MREIRRFLKLYQRFVVSAAVLVFVFLGFALGVVPAAQKVLTLGDEVSALNDQTQNLRTKAAILTAIDEATYKKFLADLVTAVPADQSLTSLFSTMDGLAEETGITLTGLSLVTPGALATESARRQSAQEKEIGTNLLPFTVTIAGSYDQIREFLARAVKVRRFFRVRGFELSLIDPTNVSVRMQMDAFYAPYLTVIGGVDTKVEALNEKDEQVIATVANLPVVGNSLLSSPASQQAGEVPAVPKDNPFAP